MTVHELKMLLADVDDGAEVRITTSTVKCPCEYELSGIYPIDRGPTEDGEYYPVLYIARGERIADLPRDIADEFTWK